MWPARTAPARADGYHPGRCAELRWARRRARSVRRDGIGEGTSLGYLGQLHPSIAERFDLEGREVYVAELAFDTLVEHGLGQPQLEQLARFPAWTAIWPWSWTATRRTRTSQATIQDAGGALLERVALFDLYQGPQVAAGKRSLAYTLRFRAPDRTLTDAEADDAMSRIVASVRSRFGAQVRGADA